MLHANSIISHFSFRLPPITGTFGSVLERFLIEKGSGWGILPLGEGARVGADVVHECNEKVVVEGSAKEKVGFNTSELCYDVEFVGRDCATKGMLPESGV